MRNHEILPEGIILENEKNILSRRELEIIILVAAGFENNQIAKIFKVTLSSLDLLLFFSLSFKSDSHAMNQ